jgi:hypothetical protein
MAIGSITLFAILLFGLPLLATATSHHTLELISSFSIAPARSSSAAGM